MSMAWATPAQAHLDALFHSLAKKARNTAKTPVFAGDVRLFYNAPLSTKRHFGYSITLFSRRIPRFGRTFFLADLLKTDQSPAKV
jgi:hypothetical protein